MCAATIRRSGTMPESVSDRISRWLRSESSSELLELQARIEYMAEHVFLEYEPTRGPAPDFLVRCRDWLDNLPNDSDQRLLLTLVPYLLFVSRREFEALYRAALNERVIPWLVELLNVQFDDPSAPAAIDESIAQTWFCAGTDSMQISSFYHVNRLTGASVRPDFKSLRAVETPPAQIRQLMDRQNLQRIVILDDFV